MSITRLQQARQMYAMGQRVAKTLDGSRPGYRGSDYGDQAKGTGAYGGGPPGNTGDQSTDRSRTTATQDYNTAVATGQNPLGIDMSKGPPDLTPKEINTFAPTVTKKTPWERTKQIFSIASVLSPHTLIGKIGLGLTGFDRAKTGLKTVSSIADTFGINTDSITDSITNSLSNNSSGKKFTTKNNTTNTNNGGDGEGLASLENQTAGYDEYILLLQKLQSGNISDSERNRYNVLKNMLGI